MNLKDPRIVWLRVSHYDQGRDRHYYAFLKRGREEEIQVTRRLTPEEADRLNKEDFGSYQFSEDLVPWGYRYRDEEHESGRFWSEGDMLIASVAAFHAHFPDPRLLIHGYPSTISPQPVIAGPPGVMEQLQDIAARWDANQDTKATRKALCQEWEACLAQVLDV